MRHGYSPNSLEIILTNDNPCVEALPASRHPSSNSNSFQDVRRSATIAVPQPNPDQCRGDGQDQIEDKVRRHHLGSIQGPYISIYHHFFQPKVPKSLPAPATSPTSATAATIRRRRLSSTGGGSSSTGGGGPEVEIAAEAASDPASLCGRPSLASSAGSAGGSCLGLGPGGGGAVGGRRMSSWGERMASVVTCVPRSGQGHPGLPYHRRLEK